MNIAIIPARGGSKRIPRKNIRPFCGKPMIAWSIESALGSGCFEKVIVSTDDLEIASIAQGLGAEVPFLRPAELADDYATTLEVIAHAADWLIASAIPCDYLCCIYPTAPFLLRDDIRAGYAKLLSTGADYVFSAARYPFPVQRAIKLNVDHSVEMLYPEYASSRSQDLEEAYHDAGQFYWGKIDAFKSQKPIFSHKSQVVVLPRRRVQDIDTFDDWEEAELSFKLQTTSD
jgi:pseudaminic acid cytidylyltransferase